MTQSFTTYTTQHTVNRGFPFHISRAVVSSEKEDFVSMVSKVHSHEYMQILYVHRGQIHNLIDGHNEELSQGELIFLPPFVKHSNQYFKGAEVFTLSFLPSLLDESFESPFQVLESERLTSRYFLPFTAGMKDASLISKLNFDPRDQVLLEKLIPSLLDSFQNEQELRVHADFCKVLQMISETFNRALQKERSTQDPTQREHYKRMGEVVRYLNEHYQETITAQRMIDETEMSATYFRMIFKELTGKSFVQYLNEIRVFHAIDLMKERQKSLKELSFEVGFSDFQNFHRSFKKIIGCSPSEFLRQE